MSKLHHILIALLILFFGKTSAQDYNGVWISTHEREIREITEWIDIQNEEFVDVKLDSTVVDTLYNPAFMLLDFINDKKVIIKGIGGRKETFKYTEKNGKLKIRVKWHRFKGSVSENNIILRDKVSKTERRETVFKKLSQSKIKDHTGLDSSSFVNTTWKVETDTSAHNYGLNYHLLDSAVAIITKDFGNSGYTNWGEWQIDWYKNHLFFGITDKNSLETKVYHFFDKSDDTLIGDTYEHSSFATEPPQLKKISLHNIDLLTNEQHKSIEVKLVGNWKALNNPIPYDTLRGVDTVINQRLEIHFKEDLTFNLIKSGIVIKGSSETERDFELSGRWELSRTGKYVTLKFANGRIRYLTLKEIEDDYLEFFYRMSALDGHLISNRTVQMKK